MQLTNKANLPDPIVRAVEAFQRDYVESHVQASDYSVTDLLNPPQVVALQRQHADELEMDVSDMIFMLLGNAVHLILERAGEPEYSENRLYAQRNGLTISGQYDRLKDGVLSDWKLMSVYEVMNGGLKKEKLAQVNLLAWLAEQNGIEIKALEVTAFYRDWSKPKAARAANDPRDNYPVSHSQTFVIQKWAPESVLSYLDERIRLHEAAKRGQISPCSPEDRFQDPTKFAVMVKGAKRSKKNHDIQADAQEHAERIGGYVELRQSEPKRCMYYCSAANWCPQYQGELNA